MALLANIQPDEGPVGCRLSRKAWAIKWRSENVLDGKTERLMGSLCHESSIPGLFRTSEEAWSFQQERYGYIHHRPDLHREPHGWKSPIVVRVRITVEEIV